MSRIFVFMLTLVVGLGLIVDQAEARRFGAGKSLGRSYSFSHRRPARRPFTAPRHAQGARPAGAVPRSGLSRWLGPLAGLAAGGLLASLFFGDHFQGIQFMDILLFGGLAFGAFLLFRAMRRKTAGPVAAGAGGGPPAFPSAPPLPMGGGGAVGSEGPAGLGEAPAWFDANAFLSGAKRHFVALQAAWDRGDLDEIRTYVTPELYQELARERAALGGPQQTEVLTLDAELVGLEREGDQVVATILFKGLIREQAGAEAGEVNEAWHVVHPWDRPEGDWLIAGIQPLN